MPRPCTHLRGRCGRRLLAATIGLLTAGAVLPASAHAVDLFPVDDWLGDGLKAAGEVVLGPLKLGAAEIARLLATIVGAIADLLVPKSLVRAGIDGIRWLVQLPPVGTQVSSSGAIEGVRMPHLVELRGVLTWIGLTLLPLGVVISAGRAFLTPAADTDSPAEVLQRALIAGLGLLLYDWAWGVLTRLSRLLTDALLGLPWVADGVERMLETLLIGGATGSAIAAEFVIPLLVLAAGGALLALLLLRVGLEVVTALVYVLGGLALGASVTGFGRRLLTAWLLAAGAVAVLPVLWTVVFVTGAALMLDAEPAGGRGFVGFVAQLYNVAAALAVFVVAIKLARGVFRQAGGALSGVMSAPAASGTGATGGGAARAAMRARAVAENATPAGLARFSRGLRGGLTNGARTVGGPLRHPAASVRAAGSAARRPVQSTRAGADTLRGALNARRADTAGDARPRLGARPSAGQRVSDGGGVDGVGRSRPTPGGAVTAGPPRSGPDAAPGSSGRRAPGDTAIGAPAAKRAPRPAADAYGAALSQSRAPEVGPVARASGSPAVRLAGARPWWLDRVRVTRRDDEGRAKGRSGRGR